MKSCRLADRSMSVGRQPGKARLVGDGCQLNRDLKKLTAVLTTRISACVRAPVLNSAIWGRASVAVNTVKRGVRCTNLQTEITLR